MKQYTGNLKTLGPSTVSVKGGRNFTFIEIGNDRIKNVGISNALGGILDEALNHSNPISIWVVSYFGKKVIGGVSRSDGTVFRSKLTGVFRALLAAAFGLGCLFLGSTSFYKVLGLLMLGWVLYFAHVNWKLFGIPANDTL